MSDSDSHSLSPNGYPEIKIQIDAVKNSGLVDADWYVGKYPEVAWLGLTAAEHYVRYGARLGKNPSEVFDTVLYSKSNKGIDWSRLNPLYHFILSGKRAQRGSSASVTIQPKAHSKGFPPKVGIEAARQANTPSAKVQKNAFRWHLARILKDAGTPQILDEIKTSEKTLKKAAERIAKRKGTPLVSIIMPTFNRATIIASAIQTVVEQDYKHWELLICDDASTDNTATVVAAFADKRIKYQKLEKGGAAAARNAGLSVARGEIIAYLDSDNYWHPHFLSRMVLAFIEKPGHSAAYGNYVDFRINKHGKASIKSISAPHFNHERLLTRNFIDLNSFVHRRELYDSFGGFNASLTRRQDYDLILKYTWARDPIKVPEILTLYQRNDNLEQITTAARHDDSCVAIINDSVSGYLRKGLPLQGDRPVKSVTIISWDLCRNHFSKPFALAEALSKTYDVQLLSFRFFEEKIFPPLEGVIPSFETVYFEGSQFPEFFKTMEMALEAIRGDVIYVVKPRLPSLGLALLANQRRGTPIILEINDLETVVASPKSEDRHKEVELASVDLTEQQLLNPYSELWSQLMDPLAKALPVMVTHNKNIDAHFGLRSLYMRNLKDEAVYDPALFDRDAVRKSLGFEPEDKVILFGGLLRKHKGIYELVELVERLADPSYKLLFAGSRPTPDQKRLVEKYGDRIRVLPPQDRPAMARINLAADLVILWLDPDVAASHYQMPYKATDALAMGPAIIANDISDLGDLARQGYLRLVPFGDWDQMTAAVRDVFDNPKKTSTMRDASRRLFQRQFSYAAARTSFEMAARRALSKKSARVQPAAELFAKRYEEFQASVEGRPVEPRIINSKPGNEEPPHVGLSTDGNAVPATAAQSVVAEPSVFPSQPLAQEKAPAIAPPAAQASTQQPAVLDFGQLPEDAAIRLVDVQALDSLEYSDPEGVAIVMPSINMPRALDTARMLIKRAGMETVVFAVEDTLRQGFIKTLNQTAARLDAKYVIYLAEDAFPGVNWLKIAHTHLEESGKGLLAFNCGKWHGRIAAFGMVRKAWVETLYGGPILFPEYRTHRADNEITILARVTDNFVYSPDSVLIEIDTKKIFREHETEASNFTPVDKNLFSSRFNSGFNGMVPLSALKPLVKEYGGRWQGLEIITGKPKKKAKAARPTYGAPQSSDVLSGLRKAYSASPISKVKDDFVLYRIVGNDLHPRHRKGQSRENLQFLLENEKPFDHCEKRFLVNRIVDPEEERAIIELLERYKAPYMRLPFEPAVFGQLGYDLAPLKFLKSPAQFDDFEQVKQQRLLLALYRFKNNYAMNNNGARNAALRDGRDRAKWVLPFDGNCFFTPEAWKATAEDVRESPFMKYFAVPMVRAQSNEELLVPGSLPDATEEPQLLFRRDAGEEFNEQFSYGRRPKVEIFWRIGMAGTWDTFLDDAWDQKRSEPSPDFQQFGVAGWVARMFSGMEKLEEQSRLGAAQRYLARADAILATLRMLEADAQTERMTNDELARHLALQHFRPANGRTDAFRKA